MSFEEQFENSASGIEHFDDDNIDGFDMNHDNTVNEGEEYKISIDELVNTKTSNSIKSDDKNSFKKLVLKDAKHSEVESASKSKDEDADKTTDEEQENKQQKEDVSNHSINILQSVKSKEVETILNLSPDKVAETKNFDFKLFLNFLKDPKAEPILKYTRSFINQVLKSDKWYTFKEQAKLIEDFEIFIYKKFEIYEPFKLMNSVDLDNCKDCMEKLITNKLYARIFSPLYYSRYLKLSKNDIGNFPDDHLRLVKNDQIIWKNIKKFGSIITLENLEIHNLNEKNFEMLAKFFTVFNRELCKMSKFRSPRDKLVCLLNSCKIIFSYLKKIGNKSLTADDFMPLLVYSVLKIPAFNADNYYLQSTVTYIEIIRQESFLKGEESYYLMSFQGALQFVSELSEENMFEKFKVNDKKAFKNKFDDQLGYITAKQLESEENAKQKKYEEQKQKNELDNQEQQGLMTAWPLSGWFSGSSPSPNEESLLSKFSNMMSTGTEEDGMAEKKPKEKNTNLETQQTIEAQLKNAEKEDLASLKEMFPQLEDSIIKDIYISTKRNVTQTIEAILEML
ncbi:hypothetical protein QEN19_003534 [Hanseniaspora menglaensis]